LGILSLGTSAAAAVHDDDEVEDVVEVDGGQ
jgi:hypothetical protein